MYKKLNDLINNDEELFCTGGISEEKINEIEKELKVVLLEDYKFFLKTYGLIIGYGVEILGCGKDGEAPVVEQTKRYRNFGLPNDYIVIRNADEWVYCLDLSKGIVVSWDRNNTNPKQVADSFSEYIYNVILEAKEDWDDEDWDDEDLDD